MSLSSDFLAFFRKLEAAEGSAFFQRRDILSLLGKSPDFLSLTAELSQKSPEERSLLALRALEMQKSQLAPQLADSELVITFPGDETIDSRRTLQVIRQMVESSQREILVAGFAITEGGGLFTLLSDAARRGVRVIVVCGRWEDPEQRTVASLTKKHWPNDAPRPVVYEYSGDGISAGMHIKCLLTDGSEILLGSANFTLSGMTKNFEMGIRTTGAIAQSARRVFEEFLRTGRFSKVTWD